MISKRLSLGLFVITVSSLGILIGLAPLQAGSVWRESTFEDFKDGTFEDGGANTYVSASGRIQTVNRWDINGDSFIDIVFANTHPLIEKMDMSLYWGDGRDYDITRQDYIPADGSQWALPADLNGDGAVGSGCSELL